jgi:ssDNA-binding replication factor A large subunit
VGILRWVPAFDLRYYVKINDPSYHDEILAISDLQPGMKQLDVEGTVANIGESRTVSTKDGKAHLVANVTLVDDAAHIVLTLWDSMIGQVNENERVRIENGYVNAYRGIAQLNVSRSGKIVILNQ